MKKLLALSCLFSSVAFADHANLFVGQWSSPEQLLGSVTLTIKKIGNDEIYGELKTHTKKKLGKAVINIEEGGLAAPCGPLTEVSATFPTQDRVESEFRIYTLLCPDGTSYDDKKFIKLSYDTIRTSQGAKTIDFRTFFTLKKER